MEKIRRVAISAMVIAFVFSLIHTNNTLAATDPGLGASASFSVLAQTAITGVSTISGDVGLNSTGAGITALTAANVGGTIFSTDGVAPSVASPFLSASVQANASTAFTTNIPGQGATGSIGPVLDGLTVTPGVYDIGAGRLNGGVLTLDGAGIYIFRASSDLISSGSINLINGARACDVFWRVTTLATLNGSSFVGTILAGTGVHFGANVTLNGRALAVGGDVTMINDTISGPTCAAPLATLHVIKQVTNNSGLTSIASQFNLHVKSSGSDVSGSPAAGAVSPGTSYSLAAGTYVVSEDVTTTYTQTFSGDCDLNGNITLASSDNKTCTITNDDVAPVVLPTTSTITVIKTVINDNGKTKIDTDFPLFVNTTLVITGVPNVFSAPATYTVSETVDSNYTQSFSVDCPNGIINLTAGVNKICIITNDDVAPTPTSGSNGGAYHTQPVPPLIDVVKVPSPLALPAGPGPVTYTYTLRNIGTVPVSNITMVGDTCSPIILASGDTNADTKLDVNETWIYKCSTTLSQTHTNTIVATGWANGISATDIANATVVVGLPVVPPLIHVTKIPNPLTLLAAGGIVTYTEKVTNPGTVALNNVHLTDDKCEPMKYISGDTNNDSKLDSTETWTYTCRTSLSQTTLNTAVATGEANGLTVRDIAVATVVVSPAVPALPNTGIPPENKFTMWNIIIFSSVLLVISVSSVVFLKNKI